MENSVRTATILVIGVGNEYRGDDGAGLYVARALRSLALPHTRIVEHPGEAVALLDVWRDADQVIVIDAARACGAPGAIYHIEAQTNPIPARFLATSTHDLGIAEAVELARLTGCLPACLSVYAIEGRDFDVGLALSPPVAHACREVAARVAHEVRNVNEQSDARFHR